MIRKESWQFRGSVGQGGGGVNDGLGVWAILLVRLRHSGSLADRNCREGVRIVLEPFWVLFVPLRFIRQSCEIIVTLGLCLKGRLV